MLDPDNNANGSAGRPPPAPVLLLAVRAVETAAWTATIAIAGLVIAPTLALLWSVTHARWLAYAAPAAGQAAIALTVLAAALAIVAIALVRLARETDA